MSNKKLTLSILAIKNHPDICSVVEYLESLDLVPAQFGDLAFAMPSEDYVDRFDAPLAWYKAFRAKFHCIFPDSGYGAYVAYSHSHSTIVALTENFEATGCKEMPTEGEQAIALYLINILEKNGYKRKDIDVVYTNDDDPEFDPFQELMDAMVPPAVAEEKARGVLLSAIPEAEIPEDTLIEVKGLGGQESYIDVPFTFAGEKFTCRFKRTYKITDREREDFMFVWPNNRPDDELCIKDPSNARAELVNFFFNFDVYTEAHYDSRMVDFFCRAPVVDIDGTIEWKGIYRGVPLTIQCKGKTFSFTATGKGETLTGGGFTYEELEKNLANCIVPPAATGKETAEDKEYYRKVFIKAHDKWAQMDIDDGGDGGAWEDYMPEHPADVVDQDLVDAVVGYYLVYHEPTKKDPSAPLTDWLKNTEGKVLTAQDKAVTRILKALFDQKCPFCSGKEVSFGSSQLKVKKDDDLAVVYDSEGVAGNFHWKFCPECGRKL